MQKNAYQTAKREMKKVVVFIVCVAMLAVIFAGCTATTSSTASESASPAESATQTTVASASEGASASADQASEEAATTGKRIFFTNAYYTAPYCGPLNQSIQDTAASLGYEVTIVDGEGDGQVQLDQIETAISEKYDAILYFPADTASSINIVKKLVESGIPFINNNSKVDESVQDQVYYVGIDPYAQGVTVGNIAKELLPDGGNVVIIQGAAGAGPEIGRTNGFKDAIEGSQIKILAEQPADWDPSTAMTVMEDFISAYRDQIDIVYTEDDGMYEGAIKAADDAGVTDKYKFISVSGNSAGIQGIKDGKLYCTIAHSPVDEGVLTVQTLDKLLKGETIEKETILESLPVTADNVNDPKFSDPGW
jgi:ribose transport system substrate-binding protein